MLLEFWDSFDKHYKEIETDEIEVNNKTIEQIKNESYNQALDDFVKEYHNHLCNENCGEKKCVDDMDKCVYWFYANEVAKQLTK